MSTGGRPEGRGTEGDEVGAVWGGEYEERREFPQWGPEQSPAAKAHFLDILGHRTLFVERKDVFS